MITLGAVGLLFARSWFFRERARSCPQLGFHPCLVCEGTRGQWLLYHAAGPDTKKTFRRRQGILGIRSSLIGPLDHPATVDCRLSTAGFQLTIREFRSQTSNLRISIRCLGPRNDQLDSSAHFIPPITDTGECGRPGTLAIADFRLPIVPNRVSIFHFRLPTSDSRLATSDSTY